MRRISLASFVLLLAALAACTQTVSSTANNLEYPTGLRLVCRDATGSFHLSTDTCVADGGTFLALVLDPAQGEIKAIDWTNGEYLDARASVPGYNGWALGGLPRAVVALDGSAGIVAALAGPDRLVRYELADATTADVDLDAPPRALEWLETADGRFLVLLSDGQARLELRDPETLERVDTLTLPHVPDRLAVSPLPGVLAWTCRDAGVVGWVDLADRQVHEVPFLAACEDGLDGDADGLIDARDPGCEHPWDTDEADGAPVADAGECANGVDDDGDGSIDAADPGCRGSNGDAEGADALLCTSADDGTPRCGTRLFVYPCADGLDNDGDGSIDAADPDCASPFGTDEGPDPRPFGTDVSFLPDGLRVLVAEGRHGALHVLDLEAGAEVPPTDVPSLQRAERVPGFPLPQTALRVVVAAARADGTVPVYALAADGLVYRVMATPPADAPARWQLSMVELDEPSDNLLTKPQLTDGDTAVEVGLTSPFAYPGFGAMEVVEQPDGSSIYYGITLTTSRTDARAESWTLDYEGVLPDSRGRRGVLDPDGGDLVDPTADFCELGVQVGDWLILDVPALEDDCVPLSGRSWQAPITAVGRDRLRVDLAALAPAEGDAPTTPPTFEGRCGRSGLVYEVRVADAFLVLGGRTGVLHGATSAGGRCVPRDDADPLWVSRARVAKPLTDALELDVCPAVGDTANFAPEPFANPSIQLTLYPGCERLESLKYRPVTPSRDTTWRFRVSGGVQPRYISTDGQPEEVLWNDELSSLFFADPSRSAAYAIEETVEGAISGDVFY